MRFMKRSFWGAAMVVSGTRAGRVRRAVTPPGLLLEHPHARRAVCRFGVVGTASPRSWYRCSAYPVLRGGFFHS